MSEIQTLPVLPLRDIVVFPHMVGPPSALHRSGLLRPAAAATLELPPASANIGRDRLPAPDHPGRDGVFPSPAWLRGAGRRPRSAGCPGHAPVKEFR